MLKHCAIFIFLWSICIACAASPAPAKVIVLAALHSLHTEVPAYGFHALDQAIESLKPDVLCLEVTPKNLNARRPERTKQEYPRAVYPLIARHHYRLYALEPSEPLYSAIVKPYAAAERAFDADHPQQAKAFDAYTAAMWKALTVYWTSPAKVNDSTTNTVLAAKHALQTAMIGPEERAGWDAWDHHFLDVIRQAARENPGKRIVVLVGVEHTFWLRAHLQDTPGILLEDTARLLTPNAAAGPRESGAAQVHGLAVSR